MHIEILPIAGSFALSPDAARSLYHKLHPALIEGKAVTLDFNGVKLCSALFLSLAIGQLLEDIPRARLSELLDIVGFEENGETSRLLEHVLKSAERYYGESGRREACDRVMKEYWEELEVG